MKISWLRGISRAGSARALVCCWAGSSRGDSGRTSSRGGRRRWGSGRRRCWPGNARIGSSSSGRSHRSGSSGGGSAGRGSSGGSGDSGAASTARHGSDSDASHPHSDTVVVKAPAPVIDKSLASRCCGCFECYSIFASLSLPGLHRVLILTCEGGAASRASRTWFKSWAECSRIGALT